MEEYHQQPTEAQKILISKVLRIPKHLWHFSTNGSSNYFDFITETYTYTYSLHVSGGALTKLRIWPAANAVACALEIEPTAELRAFSNQLMDDLIGQKNQETLNIIKKIDDDLNKIIDTI